LKQQHKPPIIFVDASELGNDYATTHEGERKAVPYVYVFTAGPPCTDKSSLNKNAKNNHDSVRNETGVTGLGFKWTLTYIFRCRPQIALIENVPKLDVGGTEDISFCLFCLLYLKKNVCSRSLTTSCSSSVPKAIGLSEWLRMLRSGEATSQGRGCILWQCLCPQRGSSSHP
jgi:site-specific DNA-cytosine methylase